MRYSRSACGPAGFLLAALLTLARAAAAQVDTVSVSDPAWVYELHPVTVTATELRWGLVETALGRTGLQQALEHAGIGLIHRGGPLTSDLYVDGFKRGDVELVIDGERYPNACPNRMDPPLTRVNPLEIDAIRIDRSSLAPQAGLGGHVAYRRAEPARSRALRLALSQASGAGTATDVAVAADYAGTRLSGRLLRAGAYDDAKGRSFRDLYGYGPGDRPSWMAELSAYGTQRHWSYGASLSTTRDVPFPYLQMDERENVLVSAHLAFRGHKLYANRTHHVMNNALRASVAVLQMETDATHVTVGLSGPGYEAYYRAWEAWNTMGPAGDGVAPARQHLMPELRLLAASAGREWRRGRISVGGRLGLHRLAIGDEERLGFYRTFYPEARSARWFVPFSAAASYTALLPPHVTAGVQAEVASTAPAAEYLYVSVRRMGPKPWWTGNPGLKAPVKAVLRGTAGTARLTAEAFVSYVARYPSLTQRRAGGQAAVSYDGVDARLAGFTLRGNGRHADLTVTYTYAQNLTDDVPLAEIAPLNALGTLRGPAYRGLQAHVHAEAALAQHRVDAHLGEAPTPAWIRFDAGLSGAFGPVRVVLDLENLTNASYRRHLSFLRDPFAAGIPLYEPGRQARLGLQYTL